VCALLGDVRLFVTGYVYVCVVSQGLANKTKEQSDSLLATLLDQQNKLDVCCADMKVSLITV